MKCTASSSSAWQSMDHCTWPGFVPRTSQLKCSPDWANEAQHLPLQLGRAWTTVPGRDLYPGPLSSSALLTALTRHSIFLFFSLAEHGHSICVLFSEPDCWPFVNIFIFMSSRSLKVLASIDATCWVSWGEDFKTSYMYSTSSSWRPLSIAYFHSLLLLFWSTDFCLWLVLASTDVRLVKHMKYTVEVVPLQQYIVWGFLLCERSNTCEKCWLCKLLHSFRWLTEGKGWLCGHWCRTSHLVWS